MEYKIRYIKIKAKLEAERLWFVLWGEGKQREIAGRVERKDWVWEGRKSSRSGW